jgi:hypothetical protein
MGRDEHDRHGDTCVVPGQHSVHTDCGCHGEGRLYSRHRDGSGQHDHLHHRSRPQITRDDSVVLTWSAPTQYTDGSTLPASDISLYRVYRAESSTGTKVSIGTPTAATFTDNNVEEGTTYYYWVTTVNATSIESDYSNEASITVSTQPIADEFPWLWIIIIIIVILVVVGLILLLRRKEPEEEVEPEIEEELPAEEEFEEELVEEAPPEEVVEEAPPEEVVEEASPEEIAEEPAPMEEAPAEEAPEGGAPAEE